MSVAGPIWLTCVLFSLQVTQHFHDLDSLNTASSLPCLQARSSLCPPEVPLSV